MDKKTRNALLKCIEEAGKVDTHLEDVIIRLGNDDNPKVAKKLIEMMDDAVAIGKLWKTSLKVKTEKAWVALAALHTLGRMSVCSEEVEAALIRTLESQNEDLLVAAVDELASRKCRNAVYGIYAIEQPDGQRFNELLFKRVDALAHIGGEEAAKILINWHCTLWPEYFEEELARKLIQAIGKTNEKHAIKYLEEVLADPAEKEDVRIEAGLAIIGARGGGVGEAMGLWQERKITYELCQSLVNRLNHNLSDDDGVIRKTSRPDEMSNLRNVMRTTELRMRH